MPRESVQLQASAEAGAQAPAEPDHPIGEGIGASDAPALDDGAGTVRERIAGPATAMSDLESAIDALASLSVPLRLAATPVDGVSVDTASVDAPSVDAVPVDVPSVDAALVDADAVGPDPVDAALVDADAVGPDPVDAAPVDAVPVDADLVDVDQTGIAPAAVAAESIESNAEAAIGADSEALDPERELDPEPELESEPELEPGFFRIVTFGLAPRFHRLLEIICRHARANPYRFEIVEAVEAGSPSLGGIAFEIALVDVTTHEGAETARLLKLLPDGRPVIEVGRRLHHSRGSDDVHLRNFSLEILSVLNHTAASLSRRGRRQTRLRLRQAEADAAAMPLPGADAARPHRPPRVLVVDPSPSIRSQIAVAIRRIGADAEEAASLAVAVEILERRRYELVITELDLPDGSGFDLMRALRSFGANRRPQVVVLSERDGWVDQMRAAIYGCSGFLAKPVTFATLHATARRTLARQRDTTRYLARDVAGAFTVRDGWLARWSSRGANGTMLPPASAGAMRRPGPMG